MSKDGKVIDEAKVTEVKKEAKKEILAKKKVLKK